MKQSFTFSIKKKIFSLTILTLIVSVAIMACIVIYKIQQKGKADLETYKTEAYSTVRASLENYVNMAYLATETGYKNIEDKAYLEKHYGHRLRNIIDIAVATLERRAMQVKAGKLSLAEAKKLAIEEIQTMRYDQGTGYIWINDTQLPYPTMIMHPTVPQLNGQVLNEPKYNCAMGKNQNLFQAMAEVCLANGEGFVDYMWPKPTGNGLTAEVKKLSYVYLFKEWDMVLGTGIYLDDVKSDMVNTLLKDLKALKYDGGQGYFWINDSQLPYPRMIMHPTVAGLDGTFLDSPKYNCVSGTNQNFFQLMAQKARQNGFGFVEYMWPKPGSSQDEPKLSYIKYFEPLDWVIGSGVYIDNIKAAVAEREEEINEQIRSLIITILLVSVLLVVAGSIASYLLADSMTRVIYLVKSRLQDLSHGKIIDKLEVKRRDEIGAMTESLNSLVDGITAYTSFAQEIGKNNLDAAFEPLSTEDRLGNSLLQMRAELKQVAGEEAVRKWVNEGVGVFSEILYKYNTDLKELSQQVISQLVKYMKANQGALYLINKESNSETYLELWACYAYDRRKFHTHRIDIGEGLAGQVVLEKDYIYMTDIPQGYMAIRSGLGGTTPSALIVLPLISNNEVQGVIELASFQKLQAFEIDFLLKISESLASTIATVRVNEVTKKLLEETQQMAEEMRAQEEELRQNMEELEATQEGMRRTQQEGSVREARIQAVLNTTTDLVAAADADFRIIFFNELYKEWYRKKGIAVSLGTDLRSFSSKQRLDACTAALRGNAVTEVEQEQDEEIFFEVAYHPIRSEENEITGFTLFAKDVSQRIKDDKEKLRLVEELKKHHEGMRAYEDELKHNLEELSASQEELNRHTRELEEFIFAINKSSVLIELDHTGTICHVNEKFCELTGYSRNEIVGQPHTYYVPKDGISANAFEELWQQLRVSDYLEKEVRRVKKDGSEFWLKAYYFPQRGQDGKLKKISCICSDITKEKMHTELVEKESKEKRN